MNNLLIAIGVLIVAVLSALFAVPYFVDWNSWRGVIEEEASRIAGRDVRIGGDITAQLLPSPAFAIQRLRVADVSTGTGEPLFRADRFDVRLSIVPLFRGVLEASEIELVRPELRLVVDDAGQGNWRSLVQGHGSLPFGPSTVALQSVKITDGSVRAYDQRGSRERLKLERIEGQLSAQALEGPYRFRGTFGPAGATREARFTTLPPDSDGQVQVKGTVKDLASTASASLDGRLRNLTGQPELNGDLTAQLPLPAADGAKPKSPPMAELKATIAGTLKQIALNDLSVAFESSGRPEVLSGGATFNYEGELRTTARLAAPWIDLDNVLGNPEGGSPLLALADFGRRINALGAQAGRASASLQIDQASLGRDLVNGIRIEVQTNGGMLAIDDLRAGLPGAAIIEVQGRLSGEGGATTFDGDMTLRGTSLARLSNWATAGRSAIDPAYDAPFQMRSRVTAEPARGGLRDIIAVVGDSAIEGEVDYAWRGQRVLRVAVSGPKLDARIVAPEKTTLRALADAIAPGKAGSSGDLTIALSCKTPELIVASQTLRDVAISVESSQRGLAIDRLQFSADHGVGVTLHGRLEGEMRGSLAATDVEGLAVLSDFFEFPLSTLVPAPLKDDLFPLRLAGTLKRAGAVDKSVGVTADGRAGTTDIKIRLTLAGGIDAWRTGPADLDLVLIGPPKARMAAKALEALRGQKTDRPQDIFAPILAGEADRTGAISRLAVRAVGVPADGMSTAIRFDSPDVGMLLDGRATLAPAGPTQLSGDVTLDARDGREVVAAFSGLDLRQAAPFGMQGSLRLDARGGAVSVAKLDLSANGNKIAGRLDLDAPGAIAERRLRGELTLASVDAATLLAPVLQARPADAQAAIQVASGRTGAWPDVNFNFARSGNLAADIALRIGKLAVADGVTLRNAGMTFQSRAGALEIRDLTGTALNGRVAFSGVLERTQSGGALSAKLAFEGMELANFGGSGSADALLTLTGGGLSPAGLVSSMTGSGTLTLTASSVREISPVTLQAAIEAAFKAPPERLDGALKAALADEASRGAVQVGPRTIALTVRDGAVRVLPITVQATPGRIATQMSLDLATFAIAGDWRVETRLPPLPPLPPLPGQAAPPPAPAAAGLLPALVQRFVLTPVDLGARRGPPAVDTSALERELAVRKVERDLAELERLRRLDEERAAAQKAAAEQAEWARQINIQTPPLSQIAPQQVPATRPPQ